MFTNRRIILTSLILLSLSKLHFLFTGRKASFISTVFFPLRNHLFLCTYAYIPTNTNKQRTKQWFGLWHHLQNSIKELTYQINKTDFRVARIHVWQQKIILVHIQTRHSGDSENNNERKAYSNILPKATSTLNYSLVLLLLIFTPQKILLLYGGTGRTAILYRSKSRKHWGLLGAVCYHPDNTLQPSSSPNIPL